MYAIIIASYATAAAAFAAGAVLLAVGRRQRQRVGTLLLIAMLVSAGWAGFLAYAEWQHNLPINWILLAETLRYGAWLAFLAALTEGLLAGRLWRGMRVGVHGLWVVLALYCVLPATAISLHFRVAVGLIGILVLALIGAVTLEQIYRNVDVRQRWALKFLLIGLGGLFAYDLFLYSYAVLYQHFDAEVWGARGFIDALLVPLLVVAAARNPTWSLNVGVSRRVVFYSSSLMVVSVYIIATAIGGYYVRQYGGDWGKVAEITLICLALLGALLLTSSGQARARLRVFLGKNFFSLRYDYREEWLRLTATLATRDRELPQRAVRAIAQIMDSPGGLLLSDDGAAELTIAACWNLPEGELTFPSSLPVFEFMRSGRWIYDLGAAPPHRDERLLAPAALASLPRAWLMVPLVLDERLVGIVVLVRARAPHQLNWEDIDLLRTAGSQVASVLAQAADARRLAEARQFEGFNRLTAFLMHDLKNVAAQQSLLLQNAQRHKRNPEFIDDMLATVANSVQRIGRVLAQLRGDAAPSARSRLRLATVIGHAIDECRAQAPVPEVQPVADDLYVEADGSRLAGILVHLIRNAQDAATASGHVTVHMRREAMLATIEIEDNGAGMNQDFIHNLLFKPFFTTKASKGMGIGAYQAREYVRVLGGTLKVDSTPGKGSVFVIRLPLAATEQLQTEPNRLRAAS